MSRHLLAATTVCACLLTAPALAGTLYQVTIRGVVESNQFNFSPLISVADGEPVAIEFLLDADDWVIDLIAPHRGYVIDQESWSMTLGEVTVGLQEPFPAGPRPFFVLSDNDPVADGFFLSTHTAFPTGMPTEYTGQVGQIAAAFSVGYGGDTLTSLEIADAAGSYDFAGLSVFHFTMDDGPVEGVMGIGFTDMNIVVVSGCGFSRYGLDVGNTVSLQGAGDTSAGGSASLEVAGSFGMTVVGISSGLGGFPIQGVVGLISPGAIRAIFPVATPGGAASVPLTVPNFPGAEFYFQVWAWPPPDGTCCGGLIASNGLKLRICDPKAAK